MLIKEYSFQTPDEVAQQAGNNHTKFAIRLASKSCELIFVF